MLLPFEDVSDLVLVRTVVQAHDKAARVARHESASIQSDILPATDPAPDWLA